MSENIEREIKISLTQEQYKTAEKAFSVEQNNRADQFLLYPAKRFRHDKYPCQADRRKIFFTA